MAKRDYRPALIRELRDALAGVLAAHGWYSAEDRNVECGCAACVLARTLIDHVAAIEETSGGEL